MDKAQLTADTIGMILIFVIGLLVILGIIAAFSGNTNPLLEGIFRFLRFGS